MYGEVFCSVKGWVGGDDLIDQETHFDGAKLDKLPRKPMLERNDEDANYC